MSDKLTVTIWPDAEAIADEKDGSLEAGVVFHDVEYVSLVNHGTFGPPALVAPTPARGNNPGKPPTAAKGESVLYVNTSVVPLFRIERDGE